MRAKEGPEAGKESEEAKRKLRHVCKATNGFGERLSTGVSFVGSIRYEGWVKWAAVGRCSMVVSVGVFECHLFVMVRG